MIQGALILVLLLVAGMMLCSRWAMKNPRLNLSFMRFMLFFHFILSVAYYVYVLYNPSDSKLYYAIVETHQYGDSWFDYYGTSTLFIHFLAYPFVNYLGLSYESMMALFSFLGFVGFLYAYSFFSENISVPVKIFGVNGIMLLLLLPNCHFWTSSLGKGSIVFLGMMLLFWGITDIKGRIIPILIGSLIVFHVRPHVFFVVLTSIALGFSLARGKAPFAYRILVIGVSIAVLAYLYQDILTLTGLDDEALLDPLISHRASELSKATSGIDIANYNFFEKVFAFIFRPLFFDAPGMLGIIVSFENLLYLILAVSFFKPSSIRYLLRADPLVKISMLAFISTSIALAQISGNLGLAIRQKSQVMLLVFFVLLKIREAELWDQYTKWLARKKSSLPQN